MRATMATTYRELLSATKKTIREVSIDEVKKSLDAKAALKLIDVRETDEYSAERKPQSAHCHLSWQPHSIKRREGEKQRIRA